MIIYLARKTAAKSLGKIAEVFGLADYGSVSGMISRFVKRMQQDKPLANLVRANMVTEVEKTIKVQTRICILHRQACKKISDCVMNYFEHHGQVGVA